MHKSRVFLREAEEALVQMSLVKSKFVEDYTKQVELALGANKGAKKRKGLTGLAIEEQNVVSKMSSFYRKKLFGEPNKKKAVEYDGTNKEEEPKDKSLFLASKQARLMPWEKTPKPVQGKNLEGKKD